MTMLNPKRPRDQNVPNKAKANPEKAAAKKIKSDSKRERRKEEGSVKSFA
jgi:hypothetical protein